ncbi:MAG: TonB-dependent receptor [Saprospiraceae bacterium]|nr:TonB-dependent receptor [Saprospiraceae bacterium]MDW8483165.1 TonB-dependent receptor [Saprospiraceae bacterium]
MFAQKASVADTLKESEATTLKVVVIQATRAGKKTPVPHTNVSDEQLQRIYHAQDVPFLLTSIPSLVETSDAGTGIGYTSMRIRGSDQTRINVTINGIPLNDAESQNVFWVDLPDLASSAAEIQVQRGVGLSTNGAGAFGATVNLDLSRVQPEPFARITNTFGSFNTRRHSIYIGSGLLGERLVFTGRLSQITSDGYVDRATARMRSYHLMGTYVDERQSVQMHVLSGHERTYQAWYGLPAQFLEVDSLRTYNVAGTERPGEPYPDEVDDYTQRHYLLHYKRRMGIGLDLQLNGHYTRGFGFYEQYKAAQVYRDYGLEPPAPSGMPIERTDLVRRRWLDNHFYGTTFALRWEPPINPPGLHAPPVLMLGGGWNRYLGRHFGEVIWAQYDIPKGHLYYDNDADKRDFNLYGRIDLFLRRGLSTLLDLQYRTVRYTFLGFDQNGNNVTQAVRLNFFNPKLGLHWQIQPQWTAYAFFGIGNREPNRDDYTQSTPASRPRPERLYDWEGGLKYRSTAFEWTVNAFYMYYRDQLALDGRINDVGAYIRTNIPQSYRLGLELEGMWTPWRRISLIGAATVSQNKVRKFVEYRDNWDTGEQEAVVFHRTDLAFSPPVIARLEARWDVLPLPVQKRHALSVAIAGKYVGRQFLDNTSNTNTVLPSYFFADLRLNYNLEAFVGRRLGLVVTVNNVLDAQFAANGWVYRYISNSYDARPDNPYTRYEGNGVYHQAGFFPQAGRNVMATLIVDF